MYILVHTTVIGFWYVLLDVYICQQILFGKPVAHVMILLNAEKFLLVGRASWQKFVPLQLFFKLFSIRSSLLKSMEQVAKHLCPRSREQ